MRWVSTRESIDRGEISVLAIVETLLAVSLLIALSIWFDTIRWLAGAVALAPLMLLRTKQSVETGLELFDSLYKQQTWLLFFYRHTPWYIGFFLLFFGLFLLPWSAFYKCLALLVLLPCVVPALFSLEFFPIRFFSITQTIFVHPLQTLLAIPENWRQIVFAIDCHTAPEFLPGSDFGPIEMLSRVGKKKSSSRDLILYWFCLILFPGLYLCTTAYRWSVKATCLIYLPLIWLIHTASYEPESLELMLKDYIEDDIWKLRRALAIIAITALVIKILLLWNVNEAMVWVQTNCPSWVLKILDKFEPFILPTQVPLWQIAPAINGLLALVLWFYARKVLRFRATNRAPNGREVLLWWRLITSVSLFLSLYTIACTLLITWKAGDLLGTLSHLWNLIGKRWLP